MFRLRVVIVVVVVVDVAFVHSTSGRAAATSDERGRDVTFGKKVAAAGKVPIVGLL